MSIRNRRPKSSVATSLTGRRLLAGLIVILMVAAGLAFYLYERSLVNFTSVHGPRFSGAYAPAERAYSGELRIVSWNIRFGEDVDAAILELRSVESLRNADLILLQEMDEEGVDRLARALRYNYVYYPASIHTHGRYFGNAVLAKWPIGESVKIVLPHASPSNRQRRIAVGAVVTVSGSEIAAYSVHTETPALSAAKRDEQVKYLIQEIARGGHGRVVVGGDFNTILDRSRATLTERMVTWDLVPVTDSPLPTTGRSFLGFALDHLYVRGFTAEAAGTWSETVASDHFPLWAVVRESNGE